MGRLIDIDELFDYFGNDAIDETTRSNIEYFVREKGTVEAIPKSDYKNRLKADLAAILTEIQLELEEVYKNVNNPYHYGPLDAHRIIQESIDALKGEEK